MQEADIVICLWDIFVVKFFRLLVFEVRMDSRMAQKTWEMSNSMEVVGSVDEIYRYDKQQQQDILSAKPWEKE